MRFGKWTRVVFACLAAVVLLVGCKKEKDPALTGNLIDVTIEPGDIYAEITFLDYGTVTCKLFPEVAPVAVEKFVALAERGYYENKLIHRVVENALMQGGSMNGDGTDGVVADAAYFDIEPSDYAKNFFGALCFAADGNNKNFCQFYIVNNRKANDIDADIEKLEAQLNDETKVLPEEIKAVYQEHLDSLKEIPVEVKDRYIDKGGYYQLDGKNTVFGQVVTGLDVIEAISKVPVVNGNELDDKKGIASRPVDLVVIQSVKITRIPLPEPTTESEETSESTTKKPKKTTKKVDSLTEKVDISTDVITEEPDDEETTPASNEDQGADETVPEDVTEAPDDDSDSDTDAVETIEETTEETAESDTSETLDTAEFNPDEST